MMRNVMRDSGGLQATIQAWNARAMRSSERLVGRRQYLLGSELVKTYAAAEDMAFATFEGARHAGQGVLHNPDVAPVLDCAACVPRRRKSANRPRTPHAWIRRPKHGNGLAARRGGKMGHRCVGPYKEARTFEQIHHAGPFHLMNCSNAAPDFFEIATLGRTGSADRDHGKTAVHEACSERAPTLGRPFLIGEHWRCVDEGVIAACGDLRAWR